MTWQQSATLTFALVNTLVLTEWLLSLVLRRRVYSLNGALTNIADYTIYLVVAAIYGYTEYLLLSWLQLEFSVQKLTASWWYWLLLFLADDFCFYWFHRLSHKLSILWMSHVVHHSSNEFNLSVGLRQTWLPFLGMAFWLPLAFAGFSPAHVLSVQAASLTYQFLMHTQLVNLPRIFGLIFNTPSHHRVHHGMNAEYLDKNFAGVLIVWDKLFGTFTPEKAPVDFGIHAPSPRGEVLFVQIWGPWQFLQGLVRRPGANRPYAAQKTSSLLAAMMLVCAIVTFIIALMHPRWFL
jgi:sterol desaturase/sphingolipid hydroxylase (fatty acid hydroxylase superfamily)